MAQIGLWFIGGAVVFAVVLIVALRRATRSFGAAGQPTSAEAKIHADAQREREAIPKPDPAAVHAMSDKELEDAANNVLPLVPRRK